MATKKKLLQAAAGNAAGGAGGLDIPDVFSTYLYTGTSSLQTITNGVDLSSNGGFVWTKSRTATSGDSHYVFDTERGASAALFTNLTNAQSTASGEGVVAFNSDGFDVNGSSRSNTSGVSYASWTWRKAPKFFDVLTYTGDNTTPRNISHNLGSVPGMIIIKCTETTDDWVVYHRGLDSTSPEDYIITLNASFPRESGATRWAGTAPTSTEFTIGDAGNVNASNKEYVAYLFAHNDGDGEFGPDSDQDIIKCGSYTGTGSDGNFVNLGFEPQWVIVKNTTAGSSDQWWMFDSMRGIAAQPVMSTVLFANLNSAELSGGSVGDNLLETLPTGFNANGSSSAANGSGKTYVYMAIRRGPLAPPESGTEVFDVETRTAVEPAYVSGFPVDMALRVNAKQNSHSTNIGTRLTGIYYANTDSTYQFQDGGEVQWDYMNGWNSNAANDTNSISWMWKRAPGYFDVVPYTGNGVAGRTVSHNLGVAPEMMWVKARNFSAGHWLVYHKGANGGTNPEQYYALLNDSSGFFDGTTQAWNDTAPTSSVFTLGTGNSVNSGSYNYIAYLFASLAGISKVGSYTGNGSSQTINCGFSSGARFILIKRIDSAGTQPFDWYIWDTERGIVAGNDPHLSLNTSAAEVTSDDSIDPENSGFIVNQVSATNINVSSGEYIFYAIA
jgi:hypothetical protein